MTVIEKHLCGHQSILADFCSAPTFKEKWAHTGMGSLALPVAASLGSGVWAVSFPGWKWMQAHKRELRPGKLMCPPVQSWLYTSGPLEQGQ